MRDPLRVRARPTLREPTLLLAYEGWNDAGEAATWAASYVADTLGARPFADIDPDAFFDFTVTEDDGALPIPPCDGGQVP